jgi:predicted nucleic acid-binding protein
MAVFADTFFYLALLRQDDPAHDRAVGCAAINQQIVTSEFILLELGNACAHAADHGDFFALIDGMRASPRVHIVALDSHLFSRGLERMASRADKDWSLIDCISFIIMEEAGIHEALTADQHFEQAGFIALLK